jgi:hypothetical protein
MARKSQIDLAIDKLDTERQDLLRAVEVKTQAIEGLRAVQQQHLKNTLAKKAKAEA